MMLVLRSSAPRIGGAPEFRFRIGKKTELQQQDADALKFSASRRIVVARREQQHEARIRSSLCSIPSTQGQWTQVQLPALYTGLKRSSRREKRCERGPQLNNKDVVRYALPLSDQVSNNQHHVVQEPSLYRRFVDYAIQQCGQHMRLEPFPMRSEFHELVAKDGKAVTCSYAFQSEKVRNFRAAEINGGTSIQVLNLVAFPCAAYDLPIFCADLVTFAKNYLIVLDLNPIYSSSDLPRQYKEKYVSPLYPLWKKHNEALPWGGELTSEALEFFSPFVIWSRPVKDNIIDNIVFDAFKDYLHVWLDMVDKAEASKHTDEIYKNQEAQHRYMIWRSTKDPGRNLLTRLYGETLCEEYMKEFLFAELDNLGNKSFLDYFPQFRDANGSIQKQRSLSGKAYPTRPWDENGNFVVSASTKRASSKKLVSSTPTYSYRSTVSRTGLQ